MWEYHARVLRVVDGDTLDFEIDLGFEVFTRTRCRLYGVDTPEIYGVKKESEEYARGKAASDFTKDWIQKNQSQDGLLIIRSWNGEKIEGGKYGRWLVNVFPIVSFSCSLNEDLIVQGHGKPYGKFLE